MMNLIKFYLIFALPWCVILWKFFVAPLLLPLTGALWMKCASLNSSNHDYWNKIIPWFHWISPSSVLVSRYAIKYWHSVTWISKNNISSEKRFSSQILCNEFKNYIYVLRKEKCTHFYNREKCYQNNFHSLCSCGKQIKILQLSWQ